MHGRIVRYLSSNGKGAVINASKMLFDFTKETWHDTKVMPAVGLFVEFRAGEKGQISDCRVSKFQEFNEQTLVSERDFWRTDTDEQLATLQSDLRDKIIQDIYKNTDYTKIKTIPLTIKTIDSIKNYFHKEFLAVGFLNDMYLQRDKTLYDYGVVKRFLSKTLDNLLFQDKTIKRDDFVDELSVITRLEASYRDFERYKNINLQNIYDEYFLIPQCHFKALLIAIDACNEQLTYCKRKAASIRSEQSILERRLAAKTRVEETLARQEKLKEESAKLEKTEKYNKALSERLLKIKEQFEKHYFEAFIKTFASMKDRIYKKIKNGLDICITLLDDKIYERILSSVALKKGFFRHEENGQVPTCLCYIEQYLDRLNKDRLNEQDTIMYRYINKLLKKYRKNYMIISSNETMSADMKLQILGISKFHIVKIASKQTQFFSFVREIKFERIYIDRATSWKDPNELISEAKALKTNKDTEYTILESNPLLSSRQFLMD